MTGDVKCDSFNFESGEYITAVTVSSGDLVDRIEFETNLGRLFKAGGDGGGPRMAQIGDNSRVVAFGAGMGGHIHHLKVFYVTL